MALTATAQSALPPDLSWDDTIVPALRKRLETESRVLSKRMSVASISSSGDESPQRYPANGHSHSRSISRSQARPVKSPTPTVDSTAPKASAIPRPSLQYSRTASDNPASTSRETVIVNSSKHPPKRTRTYSTPYLYDPDAAEGTRARPSTHNVIPTPASSRPNSPMVVHSTPRSSDVKPTRIPKASRNRSVSTSTSGHGHGPPNGSIGNHRPDAPNGDPSNHQQFPPTPETSPDLWPLYETVHPPTPKPHLESADLLCEPPPFTAASHNSSFVDGDEEATTRPSEEEHPFEHWYRGEVSRNGGVGELRVGNRMEMLDIANYGHRLRTPPASRGASRIASSGFPGRRKRAESIGGEESFYLDEENKRMATEMVLDETPLTDMEGDTETDRETTFHEAEDDTIRHALPTSPQRIMAGSSQHPAPSQPPPLTSTPRSPPSQMRQPKNYVRGASEPPEALYSQSRPRAQVAPHSQSLTSPYATPQKRGRTKSPATPNKKAKAQGAQQARSKSAFDALRKGGDAQYPEPPEAPGGMADAIPSWTQPVPKSGNWDEVVLPVVARKMGLEDQYEQANGSPRPQRNRESNVPPAPGTFAFDHSKYRPPRNNKHSPGADDIELGEVEHTPERRAVLKESEKPTEAPSRSEPSGQNQSEFDIMRQQTERNRDVPSPAPFAHYHTPAWGEHVPDSDPKVEQRVEEEENGACCRCVIM